MKLPIEIVQGPRLLTFRWRQTVSTPIGTRTIKHQGTVPVVIEAALAELVTLAQDQAATIERLTAENEELRAAADGQGARRKVGK